MRLELPAIMYSIQGSSIMRPASGSGMPCSHEPFPALNGMLKVLNCPQPRLGNFLPRSRDHSLEWGGLVETFEYVCVCVCVEYFVLLCEC